MHGAVANLRFAVQDMDIASHLYHAACHADVLHVMCLPLEAIWALFDFCFHAILHSHMLITCSLLHAIHAYAHP
jgi:hypothetical protein